MVGSYESTNCPSTNCIVNDDFPGRKTKHKIEIRATQFQKDAAAAAVVVYSYRQNEIPSKQSFFV